MTLLSFILNPCDIINTSEYTFSYDFGMRIHYIRILSEMSETIWLEPSNNKTVYLQIKNTSDKDMSGLQAKIASAVTSKGYQVVSNPDTAG
ncbi:complement resistance protein TraT, partial [Klebsiella pneumoniae]